MNDQTLLDTANRIIEEHDLDHGNAEAFIQDGELYMSVEAPNHTVICPVIDSVSDEWDLRGRLANWMRDFDADDEFNELWSRDFAKHNRRTPSQFINMLQEDQEFFKDTADNLTEDMPTRYLPTLGA